MRIRNRRLGAIVGLAMIGAALLPTPVSAIPAGSPANGMICTPGTLDGNVRTFELYAYKGWVDTPDGNSVHLWSYTNGDAPDNGKFQTPGPILCANQGELVNVHLMNSVPAGVASSRALPEPTSIVFPGQVDVSAGVTGDRNGLFTREAAPGGAVTYAFTASEPGTYIYESGTNPSKQVEMGLYGALIIRPADPSLAYGPDTEFNSDREFIILLSEIDPDFHHFIELNPTGDYNVDDLHNRYYAVNGREFPDTLLENGTPILPYQPYGSLVRIQPYCDPSDPSNPTTNPGCTPDSTPNLLPSLVRILNVGFDNHPYHPHGNHLTQIAQDGRELVTAGGGSASTERFGETVASGQTQDYLLSWNDPLIRTPTSQPYPVTIPNYLDLTFKDGNTWYSGSPYLGYTGTFPTGTTTQNVCGEWYFPWHSHALNEFTNFDEGFGGMATLLRVDPPGNCISFATDAAVQAGTLAGGDFAALGAADSDYLSVDSTSAAPTAAWYGEFQSVPKGSANLKITYQGNTTVQGEAASADPPEYSQDFDALAASGKGFSVASLPSGLTFVETGSRANTKYNANSGGNYRGNTYSYGAKGSTDRALGTLRGTGSDTTASTIGAVFTNDTGATITSLTVSYRGEQWRKGLKGDTSHKRDRLDFQFSSDATSLTTGTWTDVNALDFKSTAVKGKVGRRNGKAATISGTISGLSIPAGATYAIRWQDFDRGGPRKADDGLAVDNVTIKPTIAASGTSTVQASVAIWDWTTSSWQQVTAPVAASSVDTLLADDTLVPGNGAGSWDRFIGTGANKGLVRIAVLTEGNAAFTSNGDFMKLHYDAP
jgi:Multicopper oxidase